MSQPRNVQLSLGTATVEVHGPASPLPLSHRLAPPGAGALVRTPAHRTEPERVVLSAFTTDRPCERKANRPPGPTAKAEAVNLLADLGPEVVIDLARYGELAATGTDATGTEATR